MPYACITLTDSLKSEHLLPFRSENEDDAPSYYHIGNPNGVLATVVLYCIHNYGNTCPQIITIATS